MNPSEKGMYAVFTKNSTWGYAEWIGEKWVVFDGMSTVELASGDVIEWTLIKGYGNPK